jgi:hypothetical protein
MYQEFSLDPGSSGMSQEQWQPVTAGMEINFALESSRAGAMLTRKKGKKKRPRSGGFNSSSTSFRVQPGLPMSARDPGFNTLATPETPSNALRLELEVFMDTGPIFSRAEPDEQPEISRVPRYVLSQVLGTLHLRI